MTGKLFWAIPVFLAAFLFGCTMLEPTRYHLCPDGQTILADLEDCPSIDKEYKECEESSRKVGAYDDESERDICFYELAVYRGNASLCRKIVTADAYWSEYSQPKCGAEIALYEDDPGVCDELSITAKYGCYLELAKELEDPEMCGEITSRSKRDECYAEMASTFDDYTFCEEISSTTTRDECLSDYVFWNSPYVDWSICDEFSPGSMEQSDCYYEAAVSKADTTYCDKMTEMFDYYVSYTKANCYASVAKQRRDPSMCERLTYTEDRDDCYYDYAIAYPYDVDACENIEDSYWREDCIYYANDSYYY